MVKTQAWVLIAEAPVALMDGQLDTYEGCASIADSEGNLLFYTDGITIWNRNHEIMLNGTGLNGHPSSTNSAIVVPNPSNQNIYYIFTVAALGEPDGLQYSEINMNLDDSLGGVTEIKNVPLTTPVSEKVTAVKSTSFHGYWVVTHRLQTNELYSYMINEAGVNTSPIIISAGPIIDSNFGIGQMKISPDGSKLAMANTTEQLMLYNFNTNTGKLDNPIVLRPVTNLNAESRYGIEFSPNSEILYVTGQTSTPFGTNTWQYNMMAGSPLEIINSEILINFRPNTTPGSLQLTPNGKIYQTNYNSMFLDVIENPDIVGLDCGFIEDAIFLGGRISKLGLPPFIQSFFYIKDIEYDGICFGNSTSFSLDNAFDSIQWDFGDQASGLDNSSTEISPSHTFSSPGVYNVTANVSTDDMVITKTISVTIYETIAHQPPDIVLCDNDSNDGFETVDLSTQNSSILNGQDPLQNAISYHLTLDDAQNGEEAISTNFVTTENPQTIYARVENVNAPDCYSTTSFQIIINEQPVLTMDQRLTICGNETLEIVADNGYDEYLWSTGATSESITVNQAGIYNIMVANNYDGLRCEASKNITVVESSGANITSIQIDDFTQNDNRIIVFVEGDGDYEFSLDGVNYQESNRFNHLPVDEYQVYVRDKNGCGDIVTEQVFLVYYPNFFTPNGDGYNDTWQLMNGNRETNNTISIFNRYGKIVKQLNGDNLSWDGIYNGNPAPSGTYWFILNRQNGKQYKGHFTLKRQ